MFLSTGPPASALSDSNQILTKSGNPESSLRKREGGQLQSISKDCFTQHRGCGRCPPSSEGSSLGSLRAGSAFGEVNKQGDEAEAATRRPSSSRTHREGSAPVSRPSRQPQSQAGHRRTLPTLAQWIHGSANRPTRTRENKVTEHLSTYPRHPSGLPADLAAPRRPRSRYLRDGGRLCPGTRVPRRLPLGLLRAVHRVFCWRL